MSYGFQNYKQQKVAGASPLDLIILSYEVLINESVLASGACQRGEVEQLCDAGTRASHAVIELSSSLDYEQGGEIALELGRLYDYMHQRLLHGIREEDAAAFDEVQRLATSLKASWDELASQASTHSLPAGGV